MHEELNKIRQKIDCIDDQLIELLEKRFLLTQQTRQYKNNIHDKKREEYILNKTPSSYIRQIFREILRQSREEQKKLDN